MTHSERTMVGVPFYEREGQPDLDFTLRNIDGCLNNLNVDASIVINVNGPETAAGNQPNFSVNQSDFNAEVELVYSERTGLVQAEDDLANIAASRDLEKMFITDADIYRFPSSLQRMWEKADKPVVGAHYRPYPISIVEADRGPLPWQERLLYQIFDGDQSPWTRNILQQFDADRAPRVKGSLMCLDIEVAKRMHNGQNIITDSVMNRHIPPQDKRIVDDAYFLHMGRVDMADHIKARLRHFRGAAMRNDVEGFLANEVSLPHKKTMDAIAARIRETVPRGDFYAMLYLSRCAVRSVVTDICLSALDNNLDERQFSAINPIGMDSVRTYEEAHEAVGRFFFNIDWDSIQGFSVTPPAVTQEEYRLPIDASPYLDDPVLGKDILATLGILPLNNKDLAKFPGSQTARFWT